MPAISETSRSDTDADTPAISGTGLRGGAGGADPVAAGGGGSEGGGGEGGGGDGDGGGGGGANGGDDGGACGGSNLTSICWTSPTCSMVKPAIDPWSSLQKTLSLSLSLPMRVTAVFVCAAVGNLIVTVATPSLISTEILSSATERPLSLRICLTAVEMISGSTSDNRRPVASNNRRPAAAKENEKETTYSCVGA